MTTPGVIEEGYLTGASPIRSDTTYDDARTFMSRNPLVRYFARPGKVQVAVKVMKPPAQQTLFGESVYSVPESLTIVIIEEEDAYRDLFRRTMTEMAGGRQAPQLGQEAPEGRRSAMDWRDLPFEVWPGLRAMTDEERAGHRRFMQTVLKKL